MDWPHLLVWKFARLLGGSIVWKLGCWNSSST
jgi:hypothetical protein